MTLLSPLAKPRTLVFLTYPQMGLLDLTGAQTVFWAATKAMAERCFQQNCHGVIFV